MMFRSKIDRWFVVALFVATLAPLIHVAWAIREGSNWVPPAIIAMVMAGFSVWLVATTKYTVAGGWVVVQSGPFKWSIPVRGITGLVSSRSAISSPALSLDRLRIEYDKGQKSLLVSPKEREKFVKAVEAARSAA